MKSEDPFAPLIEKAQAGDQNAMTELFDEFFEKVFQYTAKRVDRTEVAEDITSDVFLTVVNSLEKFEGKSTFSTWIFQIAKFKIADYWREQYASPTIPFDELQIGESPKNSEDDDFEEAEKQWQTLHLHVIQCLEHLKEIPRKLLELRFLQNYTLEEAAIELNITKNTAKVTQFRALKRLRTLAEKNTISYP